MSVQFQSQNFQHILRILGQTAFVELLSQTISVFTCSAQVCATPTWMAARRSCLHLQPSVVLVDESQTSYLSREGTCLIRFSWGCPFCWGETNIWTASEVCKKCDIDLNKRAGEFTTDEVNKIVAVVSKPLEFKIPAWMLNRQRDVKDGKTSQKYANFLDQALREEPCPC